MHDASPFIIRHELAALSQQRTPGSDDFGVLLEKTEHARSDRGFLAIRGNHAAINIKRIGYQVGSPIAGRRAKEPALPDGSIVTVTHFGNLNSFVNQKLQNAGRIFTVRNIRQTKTRIRVNTALSN